MHFYYGGRIYSMSGEKRCLIEMSALAIYHHTDRFSEAERMVYLQDPISYMVRLCDDLQECLPAGIYHSFDQIQRIIGDKPVQLHLRSQPLVFYHFLNLQDIFFTFNHCSIIIQENLNLFHQMVSNNPLYLIERMIDTSGKGGEVEAWIQGQKGTGKGRSLKAFYRDFLSRRDKGVFGGKLETNTLKYEGPVQEYVKEYYGEIYCLYCFLFEEEEESSRRL